MNSIASTFIAGVTMPPVAARFGVKGAQAQRWLEQQGVAVPGAPNRMVHWTQQGGGRCLRLGHNEFLVEKDSGGPASPAVSGDGAWLLLRSDASLLLAGRQWPGLLAQICTFDFQRLHQTPDLVVMTLLAGISATLVREPQPDASQIALRLWCDATHATYLQHCLQHLALHDSSPGERP